MWKNQFTYSLVRVSGVPEESYFGSFLDAASFEAATCDPGWLRSAREQVALDQPLKLSAYAVAVITRVPSGHPLIARK